MCDFCSLHSNTNPLEVFSPDSKSSPSSWIALILQRTFSSVRMHCFFETWWFTADDETKEWAWGPFGKHVTCVVHTACMNRSVRNVWIVGEENRESVDKSKMGFLLIEKGTESTCKIHFQIGGYLIEKILLLTQPAMPRHITNMHSQCILNHKFLACHSKLIYLAKIDLKFFNHWQLKLLEPSCSGRKYK